MASYRASMLATFKRASTRLAAAHFRHVARNVLAQLVLAVAVLLAESGARRATRV